MEMPARGKRGNPQTGFPTLSTGLGNRSAIPTFPHAFRLSVYSLGTPEHPRPKCYPCPRSEMSPMSPAGHALFPSRARRRGRHCLTEPRLQGAVFGCVLAATTRLGHRSFQSRLHNKTRPLRAVLRLRNFQCSRRVNWAVLPNSVSKILILKGVKSLVGKSLPNRSRPRPIWYAFLAARCSPALWFAWPPARRARSRSPRVADSPQKSPGLAAWVKGAMV